MFTLRFTKKPTVNPFATIARLSITLFATLTIALLAHGNLQAADQSFTNTIALAKTDWKNTLSVPKFDPALGILQAVEVTLTGHLAGTARYESLDNKPTTLVVDMAATVELQRLDGSFLTKAVPQAMSSVAVTKFDGTQDYAGTSGGILTNLIGEDVSEVVLLTAPADLANFIGPGNINLPANALGAANGSGAGNIALSFTTMSSASLDVRYIYATPAIDVEKHTNGEDADTATGPQVPVGSTVTWEYIVTNNGQVNLEEIVLVDDKEGTITCPKTALAVGESMSCIKTGIAQVGQYANEATVTGKTPANLPGNRLTVTDKDPSHYYGVGTPQIVLKKYTNGEDADVAPGPFVAPGGQVVWTYMMTNTGALPLEQVTLVDDKEGTITCPKTTLAVGESMLCSKTGTGIQSGQYANTGVVTGTTPANSPNPNIKVTDSDPSHYFTGSLANCPVDQGGNAILPDVTYLGQGKGSYTLPAGADKFIVKRFHPFRFESKDGPTYKSTYNGNPPERVWACTGECNFVKGYLDIIPLDFYPAGVRVNLVIIDDDVDNRINGWGTLDDQNNFTLVKEEADQGLVNYQSLDIPFEGKWAFFAADSIGIVNICTQPTNATGAELVDGNINRNANHSAIQINEPGESDELVVREGTHKLFVPFVSR